MDTASPRAPIDLTIVIQDQEADPEDLEKLTQRTARLLEDFAEEVDRVAVNDLPEDSNYSPFSSYQFLAFLFFSF